jgi:hypothetical protein
MTLSGFDADLIGQLQQSQASYAQRYLLQSIVRSIEPNTLLSQHAAGLAGLAAELPRAQAALQSYAETGQPRESLLTALCKNAEDAVIRAARFRPSEQILIDLQVAFSSAPSFLTSNRPARRPAATSLARQMDPLIQMLEELLTKMFIDAWETSADPPDLAFLDYISNEFACLIALSDRDSAALERQLAVDIYRRGIEIGEVISILLPIPKFYRVAGIVRGAASFAKLTDLEPSAQQQSSSGREAAINWGGANRMLREFLQKVSTETEYCAISVDVQAVDLASAARLGRRRIAELLDQYIAGGRLLRLSLDPKTLVSRELWTREWEPPRPSVNKAYPLISHWPAGLREGLRVSHIARTTDAPLTAAALSWVALEACGVEYSQKKRLAQALSLQAFRQQIVESHQMVLASLKASRKYWDSEARIAANWERSHRVGLSRLPDSYEQRREELNALLADTVARKDMAESSLAEIREVFDGPLTALNKYVPVDSLNHMTDANLWVDILLPQRPSDKEDLSLSRAALSQLMPHLAPLAHGQILAWQQRLSSPHLGAEWLQFMQSRMQCFLDALYAARNLALHSGVFNATGDVVLGQGGVMLVDFTLEFLGNWYRNVGDSNPHETPREIIGKLGRRQERVVQRLTSSVSPAYPLNVGNLTGPNDSDAWDRH